ncbi:6423_t:CDS:2 [Acaulospora colombiana]|uniref:6423_t:CDS:1 n=1 Tax=Acaulospora colombiana TaxID=27376 RepID=A0ACA9PHG3_9GLOM|nr:6423_t:CDS:2 [Acaulospora colombiana]
MVASTALHGPIGMQQITGDDKCRLSSRKSAKPEKASGPPPRVIDRRASVPVLPVGMKLVKISPPPTIHDATHAISSRVDQRNRRSYTGAGGTVNPSEWIAWFGFSGVSSCGPLPPEGK